MAIGLVWEVRPAFLEGGKVEPRSEVQMTRTRGRRRLGRAAGLVGVTRLLDFIQRAAGRQEVFSRHDMIRWSLRRPLERFKKLS